MSSVAFYLGVGLKDYDDFLLVLGERRHSRGEPTSQIYNLLGGNLGLVRRDSVSSFPQGHKSSYIKNWVIKCWTSLVLGSLGILFLFTGSNET